MSKKVVITEAMVDELAQVRDQLSALNAREAHLKKMFREAGAAIYRGRHHQIEVVFTSRPQLDMDATRAALGEEWIRSHTKTVEVMNLRQMELVL